MGKTYLVQEFGTKEYEDYACFNFEETPVLKELFDDSLDPNELLENLGLIIGRKINSSNTLIFFDEIQVAPKAITSLKYFYEKTPELNVIAAGSLLGVSMGKETSFPVGKVNFLTMYPLSFAEFLEASGEGMLLEKLKQNKGLSRLPQPFHEKLMNHVRMFMFLGGMPEVVNEYLTNRDIGEARTLQREILEAYERDFSKYTKPSDAIRTSEIWNSIPTQLARENKKFKYNSVRKNGRASTFESAIEWLRRAGLINVALNMTTPKLPISGYVDAGKFEIYLLDCGLLGAMLDVSSETIVIGSSLFSEFNGAFTENFVASELVIAGHKKLFYWTSNSDAEVDFVVQIKEKVVPVEVKSGSSRNLKSLRSYADKYHPEIICRLSPRNFTHDADLINLPLYGTFMIGQLFETSD